MKDKILWQRYDKNEFDLGIIQRDLFLEKQNLLEISGCYIIHAHLFVNLMFFKSN